MKKTITLLLATTGVAMADYTDITSSINNGSLTGLVTDQISVVFTLNWEDVLELSKGKYEFFTISGQHYQNNDITQYSGSGLEIGSKYYFGGYGGSNRKNYISSPEISVTTDQANTASNVNIIFTLDNTDNERKIYVQFWDNNLKEIHYDTNAISNSSSQLKSLEAISFTNYVKDFRVYSGILNEEEAKSIGKQLVSSTVPEPTTATLSLLALAGLAARRRRR